MKIKLKTVLSLILILSLVTCEKEIENGTQMNKDFFITASFGKYELYNTDSAKTIYRGVPKSSILIDFRIIFNNQSNDTIKFKSMSCSYDFEFTIPNSIFFICPSICFGNVPMTILIPPKHKIDRVLKVIWTNPSDEKTKLSFGYIPSKLLNREMKFDTLWSEPQTMSLKRLNQNVYKN
jgi:hypothetical protein